MEINTAKEIKMICDSMKKLLLEKNARYGDAALKPYNVFSKLNNTNSIMIRLDDKLKRIKNRGDSPVRTNDVCDVIGYCVLLLVSMGVKEADILGQID